MQISRAALCSAIVSASLLVACAGNHTGESSDAGADASQMDQDAGPDAGTTLDAGAAADGGTGEDAGLPVAQTAPPQVVNLPPAGPVLTTPKVQLIDYSEDPIGPDVASFLTELTQTQTWSQQTSEYGVGALTVLPTISIAGTPPATLDDNSGNVTPFETTLAANLSGSSPPGCRGPEHHLPVRPARRHAGQLRRALLRPQQRLLRLPL